MAHMFFRMNIMLEPETTVKTSENRVVQNIFRMYENFQILFVEYFNAVFQKNIPRLIKNDRFLSIKILREDTNIFC